jgi:hypothetical protein
VRYRDSSGRTITVRRGVPGAAPFEGIAEIVTDPFEDVNTASVLVQAIVDTVREPLLVLDGSFAVVAASRSFYQRFRVTLSQERKREDHLA